MVDVVQFDGTNDFLLKSSALTGTNSAKVLTFATKLTANADGTFQTYIQGRDTNTSRVEFLRSSNDRLQFRLFNSAGTNIFFWLTGTSEKVDIAAGEVEILFSCDLAAGTADMFLNGVAIVGSPATITDDTIDVDGCDEWGICARDDGASKFDGDVEYFYLTNEFIDLTVGSNRDKFATTASRGSDGSGVTGTAALIYYVGAASVWNAGTNSGSGGNMTMQGAVTDVGGVSSSLLLMQRSFRQ